MEKNKKIQKSGFAVSVVMSVFLILLSIWGNIIHEPWFDEAQAWVIAKEASWSEIFFYIPHYEGHPPLWHIILKLVSYTGIPFITAMNLVQIVTYSAAVIIFEFKSPFKPILKILLSLGYFFLYQYSVISRPYALFMAALFLCAACYKSRKEKPFAYMLTLLFMCLCHSYGIAFAGGLVIADIIADIIDEKNFFKGCKKIISDKKRLCSYVILLLSAICLVIEIMPAKDTFAAVRADRGISEYLKNLYLAWIWVPSESIVTSDGDYVLLKDQDIDAKMLLCKIMVSSIIWGIIYLISKERGKALTVFVPYLCISLLIAKYATLHHFGIFYLLLIFALWICDDCRELSLENLKFPSDQWHPLRKLAVAFLCLPVISNVMWSFNSFNSDRKYSYDASDKLYRWIVENDYHNGYTWLADYLRDDTNINSVAVTLLGAYLDKNIFYNLNKNVSYVTHIVADDKEMEADIKEMKEHDPPDFILADGIEIDALLHNLEISEEYQIVFISVGDQVFKDLDDSRGIIVYAKKGLVKHKSLNFDLE